MKVILCMRGLRRGEAQSESPDTRRTARAKGKASLICEAGRMRVDVPLRGNTCAGTEGQVGICNGYIPRATGGPGRTPAGDLALGRRTRLTGQFARRACCRDAVIPALPEMLICSCAVAAGLLLTCFAVGREHEARDEQFLYFLIKYDSTKYS